MKEKKQENVIPEKATVQGEVKKASQETVKETTEKTLEKKTEEAPGKTSKETGKVLREEAGKTSEETKKAPRAEIVVQYRGYEAKMEDIVSRVKDQYLHKGNDEASLESIQIYIKPEDFAAYYVINDGFVGKVGLF